MFCRLLVLTKPVNFIKIGRNTASQFNFSSSTICYNFYSVSASLSVDSPAPPHHNQNAKCCAGLDRRHDELTLWPMQTHIDDRADDIGLLKFTNIEQLRDSLLDLLSSLRPRRTDDRLSVSSPFFIMYVLIATQQSSTEPV